MECRDTTSDITNGVDPTVQANHEDEERKQFERILAAFRNYRAHSMKRVVMANKYFNELPDHHKSLLPKFQENLLKIRTCIEHNYEIIKIITAATDHIFENQDDTINSNQKPVGGASVSSDFDMDKVRSTLKQIVRDWSSEGKRERAICYQPVINEILRLYPPPQPGSSDSHESKSILVPGAGLGRLAYEIASLGHRCQGNEFSLFMLFTSNFILNRCKNVDAFTLYPWVHQYCNNMKSEDQTKPIKFPDVSPSDLPPNSDFSMAAGDFLEVYTEPEEWDSVVTVFFIDTAHNIVAYIETIQRILKDGGYWINFGPLLYHFADMPKESSIELSYEDLKEVILKFDFELVKEEVRIPCGYTESSESMLHYQYDCVFFVMRKVSKPRLLNNPTTDDIQPAPSVNEERLCQL